MLYYLIQMVLKHCANGLKVLFTKREICSFQGHYINRVKEDNIRCQCQDQQKRTFLNLTRPRRKREYQGRQLVGYTMEQMYEVVSDVENYHKFVPWCTQSVILRSDPGGLRADLSVGFPPITENYISEVSLVKPHLVRAESTKSRLFHHLLSVWRFSPGLKSVEKSCVVDFQIAFEFRSAFHSHLSNLFFEQVVRQMESAFLTEVCKRNGPSTLPPRNLLTNTQPEKC